MDTRSETHFGAATVRERVFCVIDRVEVRGSGMGIPMYLLYKASEAIHARTGKIMVQKKAGIRTRCKKRHLARSQLEYLG